MRATWPGARSGISEMTTLPLVVSMMMVFSGSLISAMCFSFCWRSRMTAALELFADSDLDHPVWIGHFAIAAFAALDLVDIFHAGANLADDRVLAVEEGADRKGDVTGRRVSG